MLFLVLFLSTDRICRRQNLKRKKERGISHDAGFHFESYIHIRIWDGYELPKSSAALSGEGRRYEIWEIEEVDVAELLSVFRVMRCIKFASSLSLALQKRRTEGTLIICRNSPAEVYRVESTFSTRKRDQPCFSQRVNSAVSGHRLAFLRHAADKREAWKAGKFCDQSVENVRQDSGEVLS